MYIDLRKISHRGSGIVVIILSEISSRHLSKFAKTEYQFGTHEDAIFPYSIGFDEASRARTCWIVCEDGRKSAYDRQKLEKVLCKDISTSKIYPAGLPNYNSIDNSTDQPIDNAVAFEGQMVEMHALWLPCRCAREVTILWYSAYRLGTVGSQRSKMLMCSIGGDSHLGWKP
ncbi:hypothetical protein BD410DRAFT_796917, partial [Rickenella mellea]